MLHFPLCVSLGALGLASTVVLSTPHLRQLATAHRDKQPEGYQPLNGHSDEDVIATKLPNSRWQRAALVVTSLIATLAAFPLRLGDSQRAITSGLQFAAWLVLLLQEIVVITCRRPADRYRLGCYSALACLTLSITVALVKVTEWRRGYLGLDRLQLILAAVQVLSGLVLTLINLSIQKAPTAYRHGKPVDKQDSVSFLARYSFMWARETLSVAAKNKRLNLDDLPLVGDSVRAQTLYDRFAVVSSVRKLWRKCFRIYWSTLIFQFFVQLVSSGCHFLPQLLLFLILQQFEKRDAGADNQFILWWMAAGLGGSLVVASWFSSLVDWIADMELSLPIHEQLFAVITRKAIHLPDVVTPALDNDDDDDDEEEDNLSSTNGDVDESVAQKNAPITRHSILNLLGVDVDSISEFATYAHLMLDCVLELIIALIFLVQIVGWIPTMLGCIIPTLMTPAYYYLNNKYSQSEEALMEHRDKKSSVLTEAIHGIRQIKFGALESEWYEKIMKLRHTELECQRTVYILDLILIAIWSFGPIIMSIVSLTAYIYINGTISASTAFTAVAIFEGVESTLAILPEMLTDLLDASVSARRIERFLDLPERQDDRAFGEHIQFKDATITWPIGGSGDAQALYQLEHLDLEFPSGELTVLSGRSGSGKSLLLQAIIGEAAVCKGTVVVPSRVSDGAMHPRNWVVQGLMAYVSQTPWIENATIRNNILFGLPFDEQRYHNVLHACALTEDLHMFANEDLTDIGANGINLSGGQKWRLALARALYSRASILVLDDIFSAVDSHVGQHLYENALTGRLCKGRTRILATHHPRLCLSRTAYCVILDDGRVLHAGSPDKLGQNGSLEAVLQDDAFDTPPQDFEGAKKLPESDKSRYSRRMSTSSFKSMERRPSRLEVQAPEAGKYYEEEKRETGAVKTKIFKTYMKACGGYFHWALIVFFFALTLIDNLATPYWVSIWTRAYEDTAPLPSLVVQPDLTVTPSTKEGHVLDKRLIFYVSVYVGLSMSSWLLEIIRYQLVFRGSLRASKALFERFTDSILRAPLLFLDTTPAGRILNRFTADFSTVDSDLAMNLSWLLHSTVLVLGVIFAALLSSPLIVGFGFLSILASWVVASFYVTGAREAKRLESTARSPIFEQIGSLLGGLATVRASNKEGEYLDKVYDLIDTHCQALWHRGLFGCWMSFWLSMVGAGFVAAVAVMFVNLRKLDAPLAGFALSFALEMSGNISWLLSQYTRLDLDFNAAERVIEYSELETEPQDGISVPAVWPTRGEVEISDLHVSYAPHLPPILKGLTFSVRPGERVGIVGRTGAGKSSLTLALLRFLEPQSGSIHIDGVNVAQMRLHDLRSRMGIIPQDPVVFTGTVREVLDPFDRYEDAELRDALEKVSLALPPNGGPHDDTPPSPSEESSAKQNIFSLSYRIAEEGRNLSQGQRQLLCLARAIVSRPKILIMDEATASVDMEADVCIQRSIREEIRDCTLLVIAHRLSTIADFDRILVLDDGKVAEFDRPAALMRIEDGVFRSLVEHSGERAAIERMILAAG
ncbi:hypothetical protein FE257_005032 [Aspergillus nanangensis]|uniref:Uncharacterized protein n=1 Tax=Aspergillus nanangensis TaxID=2582783 RepID=A0AAD4CRG9_ASPNN|nr:hypothetical protein FE257_005032 [Aspergillus nanangensis]